MDFSVPLWPTPGPITWWSPKHVHSTSKRKPKLGVKIWTRVTTDEDINCLFSHLSPTVRADKNCTLHSSPFSSVLITTIVSSFDNYCGMVSSSIIWNLSLILQYNEKGLGNWRVRAEEATTIRHLPMETLTVRCAWLSHYAILRGRFVIRCAPLYGVGFTDCFYSIWYIVEAINACPAMAIEFPSDHAVQKEIGSRQCTPTNDTRRRFTKRANAPNRDRQRYSPTYPTTEATLRA